MMLFIAVLYMLVRFASPSGPIRKVSDVDFIRSCVVVLFALFFL